VSNLREISEKDSLCGGVKSFALGTQGCRKTTYSNNSLLNSPSKAPIDVLCTASRRP